MNAPVDAVQAFVGGSGAVLTPAFALSLVAVATAGLSLGARLSLSRHLAIIGVAALIFVAATLRRGVGADGLASIVTGLVAFSALVFLIRTEDCPWWRAAFGGLLVGVTAVLWRVEAFGPVLAELRGPWQSAPSTGLLALYHVGTALAVVAVYVVAVGVGRAMRRSFGSGFAWVPWGGLTLGALVVVLTGQWSSIVRLLLLKWPHVPWG